MQRRIERAFGQVERAAAASAQRFRERVAMSRTRLHSGEQQKIEMTLERFRVHSSQCYAS